MQSLTTTRRLSLVLGLLAAFMLLSVAVALAGVRTQRASLPDRVTNSPELSAIMWSGASKTFVQIQFDRGTITAIDRAARTITIVQRQAGQVWRTQAFIIPTGADVFVAGQAKPLRKLRVGMHVRIEQTAVLGAALAVVRVDAQGGRGAALPPTTAAGPPLAGGSNGTAANGSTANGDDQHPHFLPARFSNAPELAAVVFSSASNSFIERLFDRGKIVANTAGGATITILQRQAGHVWRTQTFTIPASAKVVSDARAANGPAKLTVGMHVRVEQAGPIGGPLVVVRVDSQRASDIDFPTSSGG